MTFSVGKKTVYTCLQQTVLANFILTMNLVKLVWRTIIQCGSKVHSVVSILDNLHN